MIFFSLLIPSVYFFEIDFHLQDEMVNMSTQTDNTNSDVNNNSPVFSGISYHCQMKSSTVGEMRLYAGHQKHIFATYNRSIVRLFLPNKTICLICFHAICFHLIYVFCYRFVKWSKVKWRWNAIHKDGLSPRTRTLHWIHVSVSFSNQLNCIEKD